MHKDIVLELMADAQRRAERQQAAIAIAALAKHFGALCEEVRRAVA